MVDDTYRPAHTDVAPDAPNRIFKRVSWGGILAGAVIALVIQLTLNLLGLAIGLGAINPATEEAPFSGIGTGAGIWLVLSSLIALFVGGLVAGHLAGRPSRTDGALNGVVAWAIYTFVTFYLVISGVGMLLSGALNVVQTSARVVGEGVAAVAPAAGGAIQEQTGAVNWEAVRREVQTTLRQTGKEELQPENLARRAEVAETTAVGAAEDVARAPADAEQEIQQAFDRLVAIGEDIVNEADREAAVNVLVARTDMSRQEARQTVMEYEQVAQQAARNIGQTAERAGEEAVEVTDDVLAALSSAAFWSFVAMVLGAAAALAGGFIGAPLAALPAAPGSAGPPPPSSSPGTAPPAHSRTTRGTSPPVTPPPPGGTPPPPPQT